MLDEALKRVENNLEEWENSLAHPSRSQKTLLNDLLQEYSLTGYGSTHSADEITTIEEYRRSFPVVTYQDLVPLFNRIREGDPTIFLSEVPMTWVMTRGTTGKSKVIPVIKPHLDSLIKGGSRAVLNFSMKNGGLIMLMGGVLNLQFPSNTGSMKVAGRDTVYGFSSGTYAKLNPMMAGLQLIPKQEEIDSLETGLTKEDWEQRYEFIYENARDESVITIIGVAPVQTGFARYVKRRYGVYPKDIWNLKVVYSTSVAKIQSRYASILRKMYGDVPVVEMYTATEGAFAQQKDEYPYVVPNYDLYLFEVETRTEIKMLHELKRGEWGRLIVSTPMLPRYRIGDLIEAMGKNYFRVFGRDNWRNVLEHVVYRMIFGWIL
jgi:hypothetical protein